ncbi:hypothetical protein JCM10213_007354 [Rhodosporidiobolus nylandii]
MLFCRGHCLSTHKKDECGTGSILFRVWTLDPSPLTLSVADEQNVWLATIDSRVRSEVNINSLALWACPVSDGTAWIARLNPLLVAELNGLAAFRIADAALDGHLAARGAIFWLLDCFGQAGPTVDVNRGEDQVAWILLPEMQTALAFGFTSWTEIMNCRDGGMAVAAMEDMGKPLDLFARYYEHNREYAQQILQSKKPVAPSFVFQRRSLLNIGTRRWLYFNCPFPPADIPAADLEALARRYAKAYTNPGAAAEILAASEEDAEKKKKRNKKKKKKKAKGGGGSSSGEVEAHGGLVTGEMADEAQTGDDGEDVQEEEPLVPSSSAIDNPAAASVSSLPAATPPWCRLVTTSPALPPFVPCEVHVPPSPPQTPTSSSSLPPRPPSPASSSSAELAALSSNPTESVKTENKWKKRRAKKRQEREDREAKEEAERAERTRRQTEAARRPVEVVTPQLTPQADDSPLPLPLRTASRPSTPPPAAAGLTLDFPSTPPSPVYLSEQEPNSSASTSSKTLSPVNFRSGSPVLPPPTAFLSSRSSALPGATESPWTPSPALPAPPATSADPSSLAPSSPVHRRPRFTSVDPSTAPPLSVAPGLRLPEGRDFPRLQLRVRKEVVEGEAVESGLAQWPFTRVSRGRSSSAPPRMCAAQRELRAPRKMVSMEL